MIVIRSCVANRNVFIDAYLVLRSENGGKAKFRFSTTICCEDTSVHHHYIWWCFYLLK